MMTGIIASVGSTVGPDPSPVLTNPLWLYHFDSASGTPVSGFIDSVTGTTGATGTAVTSNAEKKFGPCSSYFDGSSSRLVLPEISGRFNGDFTVQCWIRRESTTNYAVIMDTRQSYDSALGLNWLMDTTGKVYIYTGTAFTISGTISVPLGVWTHVAISRAGNVMRSFVGGVLDGVWVTGSVINFSDIGTSVGITQGVPLPPDGNRFKGYMDELAISKSAMYTESFTPPGLPFALP